MPCEDSALRWSWQRLSVHGNCAAPPALYLLPTAQAIAVPRVAAYTEGRSTAAVPAGGERRAPHVGGPGRAGRFLLHRDGGDEDGDDAQVPGLLEGFEDDTDDDEEPPVCAC